MITRGGGDELDAVKTEMATLRGDMKVLVLGFEERIKMLEENLHSSKARIEWLEAVNKNVVQTNGCRILAEVTASESTPVVEAPPSPVITGPEPAPVVAPQTESVDETCGWHKQTKIPRVKPKYNGIVEADVDNWVAHLNGTLFAYNTDTGYKIAKHLRPVWGDECQVTACRTPANRFFHLQCLRCGQFVFAQYDNYTKADSPKSSDRAMHLLADFLMLRMDEEKRQT